MNTNKLQRRKLLGISSAKTQKGEKLGYLTGILYLAPAKISGFEVCPNRSKGCTAACLYVSGRGAFNSVQTARINKTKYFRSNNAEFMFNLVKDIESLIRKAKRESMVPCIRLNGTSDLPIENFKYNGARILDLFPDVQFYDYTKSYKRMSQYLFGGLPSNYQLTFSLSENNKKESFDILERGGNVAAVFSDLEKVIADGWNGYKVINADKHDLRFLDEKNVICGLSFKGTKANKEQGIKQGFVLN